jgi:lysophospholipase L1-like esterase
MELFDKAVADGKAVTYVGNSMNGPNTTPDGRPFPKPHEGHSGWTIGKLDTDVVPEPALNQDPHIVLLHIGTNDMSNANGAPARLDVLIQQLVTAAPDALIAVSSIIPYPAFSAAVTTFNAAVPGIVKKHADAGKHVIFVEQFEDFPNNELADGIHPNELGYARMAGRWYDAIKGYLR